MKSIYIVLSRTGTLLSNIVHLTKGDTYTHVSISLDRSLNRMYSFGRLNPYNAFIGGFVHESPKWGTFKRFNRSRCFILQLKVTNKQYQRMEDTIYYFKKHKKDYSFNTLGLFFNLFNKQIARENKFYCAEFVKYVLDEALISNNLPDVVRPENFLNLPNYDSIYQGFLTNYN